MRLIEDLYVYPWVSYNENNGNTIFIDGETPVLIDPGHSHLFGHVVDGMEKDGKSMDRVKLVICTHSHPDHMEALDRLGSHVITAMGREEYEYLHNGGKQLFIMSGCRVPNTSFKMLLKEGRLKLGDKTLRVILTPGHSPGSICLYWEEKKVLISGDTLFYMGVGRTDLAGGDAAALARSVKGLSELSIDYLLPGHGEMVTERQMVEKNFKLILGQFFR
jgi:hydroxyacylglutathione hydrolase